MSVRITQQGREPAHALYDSVTGLAFGEVFDSYADAEDFLRHLSDMGERDPRVIPALELSQLRSEWEQERAA